MILADKIIMLRKKNGWSQEELAEKLNVTRQSVSKWEGAQSVPDLTRILQLAQIFEVSTDYLLKDELEEEEYTTKVELKENSLRRVSMEEANTFLEVSKFVSIRIAFATFLCIISPICLILLGGAFEGGYLPISEDASAGIGIIVLLLMVTAAVAIFVSSGMKLSPYEYLEKEEIETEYGVNGMVRERKNQFKETYSRYNIIGVCLCILSVIPLFIGMVFSVNDFVMVMMVSLLLLMVAIAVRFFILVRVPWGAMQKLLQEGDYSVETKRRNKKVGWIAPLYWLLATAIYLAYSFATNNWERSWIVWPVAGVLFAAVAVVCDMIVKKGEK